MKNKVTIIGGGLAGVECAYHLLENGFNVTLYEMKPKKFSPAHHKSTLAEIVCSNSLKNESNTSSSGLLKAEMKEFKSIILDCAEETRVPAGNALAVDRDKFSELVDKKLRQYKNLTIINDEVTKIDRKDDEYLVIATGPLTSDALCDEIKKITSSGDLYFFDASAPIVTDDSIDKNFVFIQDRYGEDGVGDYLNLPMNKDEYEIFYNELVNAETVVLKDFEKNVFEGCMPIEIMAKRGKDALRFGPLKPVGLFDKNQNRRPYAVVQLRRENVESKLYNMVGFQTNLTFKEQKRVFSLIPALKNAEFVKFGVMHKNTYINSPLVLTEQFELKSDTDIYFAGQITGVEGYVESAASGLLVSLSIIAKEKNLVYNMSTNTMLGALSKYISNESNSVNFQPMNSNYGIIAPLANKTKDKEFNRQLIFDRAIGEIKLIKEKFV